MSVCACANKHTHTYMHTHIYNTHITVSHIINISTVPKGMNPQHTGLMRIYKAYLNLATEHHSGKSNRSRNNNAINNDVILIIIIIIIILITIALMG